MRFFWKVVLRRLFHFLWIYVLLVYIFAALFHIQIQQREMQTLEFDLRGATSYLREKLGEVAFEEYVHETLARVMHERGYDKSFLLRVHYQALRALRFDFGTTLVAHPVYFPAGLNAMTLVGECAIPTVVLFGGAFLVQMILGTLLGIYNASRPGRWPDRATTLCAAAANSIPPAVAAMFMVILLHFTLQVIPQSMWLLRAPQHWSELGTWTLSLLSHLSAPLATVALISLWQTAVAVRNITLHTLHEDFVGAGRARGLPERKVLYGHAVRTASPPIVTMLTAGVTATLWGSFLAEPVFQWRGLGTLFMRAILANEINVLMALLVVCTLATQVGFVVLDLTYSWMDPRIRTAGRD